jgi:hypothetical protein
MNEIYSYTGKVKRQKPAGDMVTDKLSLEYWSFATRLTVST